MLSPENNEALAAFPLMPPLPLPKGQSEADMMAFFGSVMLGGSPQKELENYWRQDWRRFVYTYGLVEDLEGSCLELGANPYFTTSLLKKFTGLDLTLANYFGPQFGGEAVQEVTYANLQTGETQKQSMPFFHFNIETAQFPFDNGAFDIVLFCEVLEHLQGDPLRVLREIKRVLKDDGHLVLTTPNVTRLENVCRMIAGENIYDPYSGYGSYGRHNREYNKHELSLLLNHCGFKVERLFSADVHENVAGNFYPVEKIVEFVRPRRHDLGQYLFSRSRAEGPAKEKRPRWLFRSYPESELEP
jgi:SAM-dependent methyltransferase